MVRRPSEISDGRELAARRINCLVALDNKQGSASVRVQLVLGWADRTFQKSGFLDEPGLRNSNCGAASLLAVTVASVRGAGLGTAPKQPARLPTYLVG